MENNEIYLKYWKNIIKINIQNNIWYMKPILFFMIYIIGSSIILIENLITNFNNEFEFIISLLYIFYSKLNTLIILSNFSYPIYSNELKLYKIHRITIFKLLFLWCINMFIDIFYIGYNYNLIFIFQVIILFLMTDIPKIFYNKSIKTLAYYQKLLSIVFTIVNLFIFRNHIDFIINKNNYQFYLITDFIIFIICVITFYILGIPNIRENFLLNYEFLYNNKHYFIS